jgi:hypothetical protein
MRRRATHAIATLTVAAAATALLPLAGCGASGGGKGGVRIYVSGATFRITAGAVESYPSASGFVRFTSGALAVSLTQPVAFGGVDLTDVACSGAQEYVAVSSGATIGTYRVDFTVRVNEYHGPGEGPGAGGSYGALVSLRVSGTGATVTTLLNSPDFADVTETGGSLTINTTDQQGHRIAGSAQWICG